MAQLKESELKKQIKEKAFVPLYFLYGEEKYLISHYTEAIVNKVLGKSYSDFNFQAFDGGKASIDEIADAAQALPLFAERKCVLVKDLNVEALNAGELAKLYQLLEELSETTVLIISQSTLEIDAKRSAKWKKFIAAAEKNGTVVLLEKRGEIALEKQLVQWAEKRGCGLTQINAGKIIQLCGDDLLTLSSELEKLCAYAVGREITKDDIDLLVTKNLETTVFVLGSALMAGNYVAFNKQPWIYHPNSFILSLCQHITFLHLFHCITYCYDIAIQFSCYRFVRPNEFIFRRLCFLQDVCQHLAFRSRKV